MKSCCKYFLVPARVQRRYACFYIPVLIISQDLSDLLASQVALVIKNSPTNSGDIRDVSWIPVSGRSTGGGHGNTLQYCLENDMDKGAWLGYSPWGGKESDTTGAI